jgi:transcriptional regulator NrdR family protein
MVCPYCNTATQVTNSRSHNLNHGVWRRRKCKDCGALWSTAERYDLSTTHRVLSPHSSNPKPFSRDKLFVSIMNSLQHRKTATADASALTDTTIAKVLAQNSPLVSTRDIADLAHTTIAAFDSTAGAVYAALHGIDARLS